MIISYIFVIQDRTKMFREINTKSIAVITVAVFAAALLLGPVASSMDENMASAHKAKKCDNKKYKENNKDYCKKHNKKNHSNKASQSISQGQSSAQNAQCVSGGSTVGSCNNVNLQNQVNLGNNALGQQ